MQAVVPPTRTLQAVELYSHEHYTEKVQDLVIAACAKEDLPQGMKLNIVKSLTKAAFDAEPEEVRDSFFAQAAALKLKNAERRAQAREAEPRADPDPESYANAISSLSYVVETFIGDLAARTGWAFSVVGGGPDPVSGGAIKAFSLHEGRNFLGATFKKSHASFQEGVVKPYKAFLDQVYSPAICEARALPTRTEEPFKSPSLESGTFAAAHGGLIAFELESDHGDIEPDDSARPSASAVVADGSDVARGQSPPAPAGDLFGTQGMDMSLIDPQLRPGPPPSISSTTIPFTFPSTPYFAPQAAIGSAVSPSLGPSPSSTPPAFSPPVPTMPSLRPVPSPLSPTTASVDLPSFTTSPPAVYFAPQAAIGSAVSSSLGPSPSSTPPAFSPPVPMMPSLRLVPSPLSPTTAGVDLPSFPTSPPAVSTIAAQPMTTNTVPLRKKGTAKKPKPRNRPAVQSPSRLQDTVENPVTPVEKEQGSIWSKELSKALKAVEAKAEKAAEAKAARAAKVAEAKATKAQAADVERAPAPAPASSASVLQSGRPHRVRKATTSKEVVPLTDDRKRKSTKENDSRPPKKIRTR